MALMKMSAGAEGKADVVVTNPAAGGVTVAAGECALWVGSLLSGNVNIQQSVHAFVNDALERLREVGTPTPGSGTYLTADASFITQVPYKKDITVTQDAAFSTPASNGIQIYVGDLFQPTNGASISTAIKRMLEVWMEQFGKKAA